MVTITNYGFVIDNRKCIGCHACTVACKGEHDDPIGVNKTWVKYIEKGEFPNSQRNFSVMRCNHCNDSPCTDVCPVTALWEREDGIVDFDPERCIGCKACMQGCPYDALYIDPETSTAAKCNYCSHRVDSGREPACVTVCPEDAIIAGDMENKDTDISRTIATQEVQARKPEKGTEPKLFYVDGDEGSVTPGSTGRSDHYMWSDAPSQMETRGAAREEFNLRRAAESLANSDVSLPSNEDTRADGGCACGGDCACGKDAAADGGVTVSNGAAGRDAGSGEPSERSAVSTAYELLNEEARRVYDIGETHYRSWGWEVYSYTMTKSISAGALLLPALLMLGGFIRPDATLLGVSSVVSGVFLALTGILLVMDLDQPQRFHWVLLRPNWKSWLVKGAYIISGFGVYLALTVLGWLLGASAVTNPVALGIGAILATATGVYTAFLFSDSKGRDLWQSALLPFHLFVQLLLAGSAVTAILGLFGYTALVGPSVLVLAASIVVHGVFIASELFTPHQTEDAEEAAARIVRGEFSRAFWYGGVGAGIVIPLVILAVGQTALFASVAGVVAVCGLFAYEYCFVTAPQTISLA